MTGECSQHSIEIVNLSDGEVINHSILLIKGHVSPRCIRNEKTIHLEQQSNDKSQFIVTPVSRRGEFKILSNLRQYENEEEAGAIIHLSLHFQYCNAASHLQLNYKTPESKYRLQPILIICRGEEDASNERRREYCEKIDLNLRLVQCVFADKIRAAGFGRRTFTLNHLACQLFHSELSCEEAWQRNEDELWEYFGQELLNSKHWSSDISRIKFVAFIAVTKYDAESVAASGDFSYVNIRRHLKAHAALGGGGLALFGSAFFYAWPRHFDEVIDAFGNQRVVDVTLVPDDSNYRRTWGGVYATTLGAILHELGHIFDLGHTNDGVMGTGFDYINRVFTIDNRTENLPTRIIQKGVTEPPTSSTIQRPRFTLLKGRSNKTSSFLDKYHEQKNSDSVFFTRNCVVILAHHKWLCEEDEGLSKANTDAQIAYDVETNSVISLSNAHPLKLIELRCKNNSLVTHFYEFQNNFEEVPVLSFKLPQHIAHTLKQTHYIFVLTTSGITKRLQWNARKSNSQSKEATEKK